MRFVDEKPRIERRKAVETVQSNELSKSSSSRLQFHSSHLRAKGGGDGRVFSAPTLTRNILVHKNDCLIPFLVMKLRSGGECSQSSASNLNNDWRSGRDPEVWIGKMLMLPHQPLLALAAMFFGRAHHLQDVVVSALCLYGTAISETKQHLFSGESVVDFGTLAWMTTLCMFEVMFAQILIGR